MTVPVLTGFRFDWVLLACVWYFRKMSEFNFYAQILKSSHLCVCMCMRVCVPAMLGDI